MRLVGKLIKNVVISQTNLINWISMKHLFHGVVEYVQENFIMIRHSIMNILVYSFYEETYGLIRTNLLSLIVEFDRIDAAMKKTTNQTFKVNRSIQI